MPAPSPESCTADFTAALLRRDIDAALALLSDDVVFFYSNGSVIAGKAAFAAMMTGSWKVVSDYVYEASGATWVLKTDAAAAVLYAFAWSGQAGGNAVSGGGRGTRLLRRGDDGWVIVHEHLSTGQGPV